MPEIYYREDEVFLTNEEVDDSAYVPEKRLEVIVRYLKRCDGWYKDFRIKMPKAVLSIAAFNLIYTIDSLPWDISVADEVSDVINKICTKLAEIKELYDKKQKDKALKLEGELRRALSEVTL